MGLNSSSLFECDLDFMTCFQKLVHRKGEIELTVEHHGFEQYRST